METIDFDINVEDLTTEELNALLTALSGKEADKVYAKIKKDVAKISNEIARIKELASNPLLFDIHLQNVYRFFKKVVTKKDPLRDAIKAVVFGVIYGKGAGSLGRDMWTQAVKDLKDAIYELRKKLKDDSYMKKAAEEADTTVKQLTKDLTKQLSGVSGDLEVVLSDKTKMKGRAEEVMVKMSKEWKRLYKWMEEMHKSAAENYYVEAPHGRRRHLYGMMIPNNNIQAALCRRAVNAPVQGYGADVGHAAARLIELELHRFLRKFKLLDDRVTTIPGAVECAVHDALLQTPEYKLILPTLQIQHFCMTIGVSRWFSAYFGNDWLAVPEVETEIGFHEAEMVTWDFTKEGLATAIRAGVEGQFKAGLFPKKVTVDDVMEDIMNIPKEWQTYLDKRCPWFAEA